ncbi:MAG: hypothetical protein CBC78_000475 [Candidatus Pelagibacter sp. TMED118]|nr:MAG: hypothetical protein CBC78_000475 [Candidatus Pelagibacter sp. TMED118]|tara:strand:+ start:3296 stop:3757 length:462 start_codon:yes stop_codon:yes gene_type:complete
MKYFSKTIIVLILLTACGYTPILSTKVNNLRFKEFNTLGDEKISLSVLKNLNINKSVDSKNDLEIYSEYQRVISSKNKKGNPEVFNLILNVNIKLMEDNSALSEKKFYENITLKNEKNKFNLKKKENNLKSNLINKISQNVRKYLLTLEQNDN